MQNLDLLKSLIAIIPIVIIFIFMLVFKMASYKAGIAALAAGCVLAFFMWNADIPHIGQSILEGFLSALMPIAWVIFMAMLLYNLSVHCGAMDTIRKTLVRYAPDKATQVLLIAFGFGSFLEAVSGFGTPVVVVASILMLFGFEPLRAAVICLVANTVSVAFGVIGIPVITLANVSSLPVGPLSVDVSLQLLLFSILLPFLLVAITLGGVKGIKKYVPLCLLSGITFAAAQLLAAWLIGPELAAVIGSLCSMAAIVAWQKNKHSGDMEEKISARESVKSFSAYIVMFILVVCTRLLPFLSFLSGPDFTVSLKIYQAEGAPPYTASLLTNSGSLLLFSVIVFCFIYRISPRNILSAAWKTLKQARNAILTVLFIVALAKVLSHSGMINDMALGFAALSGSLYPLIAPVIGCIGTFVTGSDTSANVLFGLLQKQTALYIGADPLWITAANASGAVIGKVLSPLSIALASSSTGLKGKESQIFKNTIWYAVGMIAVMAVFIFVTSTIL